jgi:CelD/BcsL family acetyltransferase involved in cellulose biosynthesis
VRAERIGLVDLAARAPAWTALWERVPGARAFQHPAWQLAWAEVFAGDGEVVAHVVASDGELLGVLPLWLRREDGRVVARLLGVGASDTLDLLAVPDRPEVVAALLGGLETEADVVHLDELPDGSPLVHAALRDLGPAAPADACSFVRIDGWRRRARHGMLKELGRLRRQAVRDHGYVVEVATADTLDAWLDALVALHGLRWAERGGQGMLADPQVRSFHRAAAEGLLAAGRLEGLVIRMDDRAVAAGHVLLDRDGASFYLHGFDPAAARSSPGALLFLEGVERTEARGGASFDLLRGSEPFKAAWGPIERRQWRRTGTRRREQFL